MGIVNKTMESKINKNISPRFCEGIIRGNIMYGFDNRIRAMCKIDLNTMSMRVIRIFKSDKLIYVKRIFEFDGIFVMQDQQKADLILYDKESNSFKNYVYKDNSNIIYCIVRDYFGLILLPLFGYGKILRFDLKTCQYFEYKMADCLDKDIMVLRPFRIKKSIYYPSLNSSFFVRFDIDSGELEKVDFLVRDVIPYVAAWDVNGGWLIEKNANKLYGFGAEQRTFDIPSGIYSNIVILRNYVCLMPQWGYRFILIAKKDGKVRGYDINQYLEESAFLSANSTPYVYCSEDDKYIYIYPNFDGEICRIDKKNYEMQICNVKCDEYGKILFDRGNVIVEKNSVGLGLFIDTLVSN